MIYDITIFFRFYLHENHYPTVKQGLIDMDPDVDAMIRLTRKFADAPMNIYFNPKSPAIMIPKGNFQGRQTGGGGEVVGRTPPPPEI